MVSFFSADTPLISLLLHTLYVTNLPLLPLLFLPLGYLFYLASDSPQQSIPPLPMWIPSTTHMGSLTCYITPLCLCMDALLTYWGSDTNLQPPLLSLLQLVLAPTFLCHNEWF